MWRTTTMNSLLDPSSRSFGATLRYAANSLGESDDSFDVVFDFFVNPTGWEAMDRASNDGVAYLRCGQRGVQRLRLCRVTPGCIHYLHCICKSNVERRVLEVPIIVDVAWIRIAKMMILKSVSLCLVSTENRPNKISSASLDNGLNALKAFHQGRAARGKLLMPALAEPILPLPQAAELAQQLNLLSLKTRELVDNVDQLGVVTPRTRRLAHDPEA